MSKVAIIIVTHNSQLHLNKAIECIQNQTFQPSQVIVVDSGSQDLSYLHHYQNNPLIEILFAPQDIGFCVGNNLGWKKVRPDTDYVFFLNPDAFLTPTFLKDAVDFMEQPTQANCGAFTGTILKYDIKADQPLNVYDTTGVFHTWYGRWYDRAQGGSYAPNAFEGIEHIPAICGAVLFCRKKALDSVLLPKEEIFNSRFFMYKEDIDLSLRMRQQKWTLCFNPKLLAYHCRGWTPKRKDMPRKMRLHSAKNELWINTKHFFPIGAAYSLLKYCAVKFLDM